VLPLHYNIFEKEMRKLEDTKGAIAKDHK